MDSELQWSWTGVMPAITTPFDDSGEVDHAFLSEHAVWLVDHGATGIIPCGSLGEGATLSLEEKQRIIDTCVRAVGHRVPVIPGIAAADAVPVLVMPGTLLAPLPFVFIHQSSDGQW